MPAAALRDFAEAVPILRGCDGLQAAVTVPARSLVFPGGVEVENMLEPWLLGCAG